MKKSLCFLIGLLIIFSFNCYSEEMKTTAAVMDLQAEEGVSASVSRMLSDYLRTLLVNTNEFTIVTRENMEQVLKEQAFQLSGCTSQECIVQVGQLLGVRKMFAGSIGKVGQTYQINLKVIDIESGKIEKAETELCPKCEEDNLYTSLQSIVRKIVMVGPRQLTKKQIEEVILQKYEKGGLQKVPRPKSKEPKRYAREIKWGIQIRGIEDPGNYISAGLVFHFPYFKFSGSIGLVEMPLFFGPNSIQPKAEALINIPFDWWAFQFGFSYSYFSYRDTFCHFYGFPIGFEFFLNPHLSLDFHLGPAYAYYYWNWQGQGMQSQLGYSGNIIGMNYYF